MSNLWNLILGETATPEGRNRDEYFSEAEVLFNQYCHLKQALSREVLPNVQAAANAFKSLTGVDIKKAEGLYLDEIRSQRAEEKAAPGHAPVELNVNRPKGTQATEALERALGKNKEK